MHRDPLYDEIARVAYDLFEKNGRKHGHHLNDWFEAEKMVKARHAEESAKKVADIAGAENAERVRRKRKEVTGGTEIGACPKFSRKQSARRLHP